MLNDFLSVSAAWGVLLTLAAFALGALINRITGKAIFNPLLLGSIFVIIFLSVCKIPYADYKASAAPVNYLLLPATVALAIPLYEKWDPQRTGDPCQCILEEGGTGALICGAANFFIIEKGVNTDMLFLFSCGESTERGESALKVIQPGGRNKFMPLSPQGSLYTGIKVQVMA